jgi:hypothetical protein
MVKLKLYHHKTDGGAEYLTDTFIPWKHDGKSGREGHVTEKTKILIRLDGQPEVIRISSEDERAELLAALKGAQSALRKALPQLNDEATHYCGEWLDEINETIKKAEEK